MLTVVYFLAFFYDWQNHVFGNYARVNVFIQKHNSKQCFAKAVFGSMSGWKERWRNYTSVHEILTNCGLLNAFTVGPTSLCCVYFYLVYLMR